MEDYEQLYYDSLYTIKRLKQQNETLENDLQLVNKNKIKNVRLKNIILEQMKKYKEEEVLKAVEDVVNILVKVKDGILKFYIENGYIYCENTKSQERVVVGTIGKKGGSVNENN